MAPALGLLAETSACAEGRVSLQSTGARSHDISMGNKAVVGLRKCDHRSQMEQNAVLQPRGSHHVPRLVPLNRGLVTHTSASALGMRDGSEHGRPLTKWRMGDDVL